MKSETIKRPDRRAVGFEKSSSIEGRTMFSGVFEMMPIIHSDHIAGFQIGVMKSFVN